jgi:hypothetical protein
MGEGRPNEKYAKGWPMMRRQFDPPPDWSGYDYLYFWLHTKTSRQFLPEPALRVGLRTQETKDVQWYTIPKIEPNQWQEVAMPFSLHSPQGDTKHVTGISFYVAEAWYEDGDKIDFYIDDMRLARRTVPALGACTISARTFPRGQAAGLHVQIEGPFDGAGIRCTITDTQGNAQSTSTHKLTASEQDFPLPLKGLAAGGHHALIELLNAQGTVLESQRKYFQSLQPGKRCYLKLITFYTKPLMTSDPKTLSVLNDSAYAGVAIPMQGSYDTGPVPEYESLRTQLGAVREALKIDPWPWVALNRFIGAPADRRGHANSHADNIKYFLSIKGMDLDNESGARADVMKAWRNAVRGAREWKSPGIMWDPEAYNDYRAYQLPFLAKTRGESIDEAIRKCEALGADLAKIIAEEYPACVVWSLFSRFEHSYSVPGRKEKIFTSPTYITLGLLRYAKQNKIPLKYLCGGETTPGYCNKSVEALKHKIAARDDAVAPFLEEFPAHFFLAGTISPFHDYGIATSFIQKGYAGAPFKTIRDFEPMFKTLFDAYDWVWIYASSAAKTLPYEPKNNQMYSEVLRAALDASAKGE